jgi:glycosyltransferase involved in cell wall biosynthesis
MDLYKKSDGWFWQRLKRVMLEVNQIDPPDQSFTHIRFDGFDLFFSNAPLVDKRGIGRTCQAQLQELSSKSVETVATEQVSGKSVHFYASIHWCPDILPKNSVIMIHDVIPLMFPEMFSEAIVGEWESRYKRIAAQAVHIITISQSNVVEIGRLLDVPLEKITLIYNGVTPMPAVDAGNHALPVQPYVVFLGADDRHKNLDVVLQALVRDKLSGVDLVLIGDNKTQSVIQEIERLGLSARVHFMGRLEDAQIGYVLKHSQGLVSPSLYEGFGLPPMEAALLGVPAICSNRPAMSETLESAAIFVEPDDVEGWASAIHQLVYEPETGSTLGKAAQSHVATFTWEVSVQKLLDVLATFAK